MKNDVVATSSPYGHACVACARSKCRCIPRSSGGGCQRCYRLRKDCRPSVRARNPKPLSRTAQLEQRVDELVALLRPTSGQSPPSPATQPDSTSRGSLSKHHSCCLPAPAIPPQSRQPVEPTPVDEEEFLRTFLADELQYLPFIYLPPGTSAQQLKNDYPFLWRCIVAVQIGSAARHAEMVATIRREVADRLIVDCQKSMDVLLGLVVFLAWICHQGRPQKSSLCIYAQLATAVVTELGLNRRPPRGVRVGASGCTTVNDVPHLRPPMSTARTTNERRAVLGFFVLSSSIAQLLGRMDPLGWTSHLSECLETLADAPETKNDTILVQVARLCLVVNKIESQAGRDNAGSEGPRAPSYVHLASLRFQLDDVKRRVPEDLLRNVSVQLHMLHAEVTLYATALIRPVRDEEGDPKRLDHLYACLVAVRRFFDLLATVPSSAYAAFSMVQLSQIAHSSVVLFRLSILDLPGWDRTVVRSTIDLLSTSDQIDLRLQEARRSLGAADGDGANLGAFTALTTVLHRLRAGWAARLEEVEARVAEHPASTVSDADSWDWENDFALSNNLWLDMLMTAECSWGVGK